MKKILLVLLSLIAFPLSGCGGQTQYFTAPDGKILIEEYSDIFCPYCSVAHKTVSKLKEEFPDDIYVRFVHFPLTQLHPGAFHAAVVSECFRDEGEEYFWKFLDKAFENQSLLNDDYYLSITEELGLDTEKMSQCFNSGGKDDLVKKNYEEGVKRSVQGTPTLFLDGEMLESTKYEAVVLKIRKLVDEKKK